MKLWLLVLILFTAGCAAGQEEISKSDDWQNRVPEKWQPKVQSEPVPLENEKYDLSSFNEIKYEDLPGGKITKDLEGKLVKIKVSYVGVAPGFNSGGYPPDKYFTFLVGKPVNQYQANNPMRGPRGHLFSVIENIRAGEVFSLPQDKNFYFYAKVVYLGETEGGEYGLRAVNFER